MVMRQSATPSRTQRSPSVDPATGWTYLSREALARAKAQMDEESKGVRDEIGFLTIHQRYADRFFPGTSVLHMRSRIRTRGASSVSWAIHNARPQPRHRTDSR